MLFLCDWPDCTYLTRWKTEFEVHRRRHSGNRILACSQCEKRFFCRRDLNIHLRTHSGEKPYKCKSCDRHFTQKGQLNSHLRKQHPSEIKGALRKFPCHTCGKVLRTSDGLLIHQTTHSGRKPHPCGVCGQRFVSRSNLRTHSTLHAPHHAHQCEQCGKTFRLKSMLTEHLLSHSGFRPHRCGECGRGFKRKQQLQAHCNTHSGETPFACGQCGKKFKSSSRLSHHKKRCHDLQKEVQSKFSAHSSGSDSESCGSRKPLETPDDFATIVFQGSHGFSVSDDLGCPPPLFQDILGHCD